MDEPFAALDAQTREAMQSELLQLQKKTNCTILFVTHDVAEAAFLGNRVLILSRIPARITNEVNTKTERDLIGEFVDLTGLREEDEVNGRGFVRGDDFRYSPRFLEIQRRLKDRLSKQTGSANSAACHDD
jgi:ABC-type nitrate/sulfonate/bicarbonate transport system ATPase subunit